MKVNFKKKVNWKTTAWILGVIIVIFIGLIFVKIPQSVQQNIVADKNTDNNCEDEETETWELVDKISVDMFAYYPLAVDNIWKSKGQHKEYCEECEDYGALKPYESTVTVKSIKKNADNIYKIEEELCIKYDDPNNSEGNRCQIDTFYLINNSFCYDEKCSEIKISFPIKPEEVLIGDFYQERLAMGIDDKHYVNYIGDKITTSILGRKEKDCFEVKYYGLPDENIKVFCYGIGYVSCSYKHHGPYDDYEEKLVEVNFNI